ncbi:MAG TPA: ABC transporter ATP-binding protein [Planctomycetota bacterium]|nr:ABC transporter ATP-binding protein [Planctomycetota bacterium]
MAEILLESRAATRVWRGRAALEAFDLAAEAGTATAVLGVNGAGKSTALRLCAGELTPSAGVVRAFGADPRAFATRRKIGYLAEGDALEPFLGVDEAARYLLRLYGGGRSCREWRPIAERYGLGGLGKKRVAALSKGQRRRLELARLRLADPPLWILDEPDSGLDPAGLRLLREEIRAACGRGRAVVFSTHAVADAAAADRILVLRGGRAAFDGTPAELARRTGASAFTLRGGPDAAADALRDAAARAGATLDGPEPSVPAVEALLFGDAAT